MISNWCQEKWLTLHEMLHRSEDEQLAFSTFSILKRSESIFKIRLRGTRLRKLQVHAAFVGIILPSVVSSESSAVGDHSEQRARRSGLTCSLCLLCGHEMALVVLIADFADVPRGRPLHRLREAVDFFLLSVVSALFLAPNFCRSGVRTFQVGKAPGPSRSSAAHFATQMGSASSKAG